LCDFGLASNTKSQAGAGTPQYMAPELLQGKPYNEKVGAWCIVYWGRCAAAQAPKPPVVPPFPSPSPSLPLPLVSSTST